MELKSITAAEHPCTALPLPHTGGTAGARSAPIAGSESFLLTLRPPSWPEHRAHRDLN